jgi:hypothetical protein
MEKHAFERLSLIVMKWMAWMAMITIPGMVACTKKNPKQRASDPQVRTRARVASKKSAGRLAPDAKIQDPTKVPPFGLHPLSASAFKTSPLTPKLERLVKALKAQRSGSPFRILDVISKYIPGFASGEGSGWPKEASVDILEVETEGVMVAAFVRVTPKSAKRVVKGEERENDLAYALFIRKEPDKKPRLSFTRTAFSKSPTMVFAGTKPRVVFPHVARRFPIFHIQFRFVPTNTDKAWEVDSDHRNMVEVYYLSERDLWSVGEDPYQQGVTLDEPGSTMTIESELKWVLGKTRTIAYLVNTRLMKETISPCTGLQNEDSKKCREKYRCKKSTRVVAKVTQNGVRKVRQKLSVLRKREPKLSRFPRDVSRSTERACEDLEL